MPARPVQFPATARDAKVLLRLRKFCNTLPEFTETGAFGHPNFRAGKKTFAAYEPVKGRPSIAFKLNTPEVDLILLSDDRFFPTPYGRGFWISLWADEPLDWKEIEKLLLRSYRGVALQRMLTALGTGPRPSPG